jgi:hypothetical protein
MDLNSPNKDSLQFNIKDSRQVSAKNGWFWINEGFRYLMQGKLMWMASLSILASFFVISRSLPGLFQIIIMVLFPMIAGGFAIACYEIENGKKMSVEYLFSGMKCENKANLFRYGFVLFLLIILVQIISSIILTGMGITQEQIIEQIEMLKNSPEASFDGVLASPVLVKMMVVSIICLLPIILINLLAPIILVFSNYTAWQVVPIALKAGLKNIAAFIVYAILFVVLAILPIVLYNYILELIIGWIGDLNLLLSIVFLSIVFIYIMLVAALSYCSAYVAFKDIFLGEEI